MSWYKDECRVYPTVPTQKTFILPRILVENSSNKPFVLRAQFKRVVSIAFSPCTLTLRSLKRWDHFIRHHDRPPSKITHDTHPEPTGYALYGRFARVFFKYASYATCCVMTSSRRCTPPCLQISVVNNRTVEADVITRGRGGIVNGITTISVYPRRWRRVWRDVWSVRTVRRSPLVAYTKYTTVLH